MIHTRWTLKNTRYIHEVGGFFHFNETKQQKPHKQLDNTLRGNYELVIHYVVQVQPPVTHFHSRSI